MRPNNSQCAAAETDMTLIRDEHLSEKDRLRPALHELKATPKTVHWGYFDAALAPALKVASGDIIRAEAVTQHAGDAPELMMDEGITAIFKAIPEDDRNPGVHIMTGPIYVDGAKPGDVLEVRDLEMRPRLRYGSNLAAHWGHLYKEMGEKERVTLRGIRVPVRPHLGTAGVAPDAKGRVSTVPPGSHGGNIDNWRIGAGATMFYPVQVDGALFSIGDPHISQGDGEISGTAIEASLDVMFQVFIRRDFSFPSPLLRTPEAWMTHGFDEDLDQAMRNASLEMLRLLTEHRGLSRDDAYSLMSGAGGVAAAHPQGNRAPPR
jgi:acetamidase/formamidase